MTTNRHLAPLRRAPVRLPMPPDPVDELIRRNGERGAQPDWRSGMPEWRHDRDVPWEIETAAVEALERSEARDAQERETSAEVA